MKDKIKKCTDFLFAKSKNDNKKNIENLVVFLILLIITVIAINTIWGEEKIEEEKTEYKVLAEKIDPNINSNKMEATEYNLQEELKDILSKIQGVGKVEVLITYSETSSIAPIYNQTQSISTTEETDTEGGKRIIESTNMNKEIVFEENSGNSVLITEKLVMPKIEGAIITAEGANNSTVKTNIVQAVVAVTGVSSYKVQVFEMAR